MRHLLQFLQEQLTEGPIARRPDRRMTAVVFFIGAKPLEVVDMRFLYLDDLVRVLKKIPCL
jgi:hypothetical protein